MVIGITPTRPETGYGYQQIGARWERDFESRASSKSHRRDCAEDGPFGQFLWNAGMFVMRAGTLARNSRRMRRGWQAAERSRDEPAEFSRFYGSLEFDAFDRVVVEKSANVLGVRADSDWHDVGSWEGLWEACAERTPTRFAATSIAIDSEGVLARADTRLTVLLGVSELVVVDSGDAILMRGDRDRRKSGG